MADNILANDVDLDDVHGIHEDETHFHIHHAKSGMMSLPKGEMTPEMSAHMSSVKKGLDAADKALQSHQDEQGRVMAYDGSVPIAAPQTTNPDNDNAGPVAAPWGTDPDVMAKSLAAPTSTGLLDYMNAPSPIQHELGYNPNPDVPVDPRTVVQRSLNGFGQQAPPDTGPQYSEQPPEPPNFSPQPDAKPYVGPTSGPKSTLEGWSKEVSEPGKGGLTKPSWGGSGPWSQGRAFDQDVRDKLEAVRQHGQLLDAQTTKTSQIKDQRNALYQSMDDDFNKRMSNNESKQQGILDYLSDPSNKLDPRRFYSHQSTGQRVLSGISVFLGGLAGGMNGSNHNVGLDIINKAVNDDIDAQKANRADQYNQFRSYTEQGRTTMDAHRLAKADALDTTAALLSAATDRFAGPLAKSQAAADIAQLKLDAMNNRKIAEMNDIHLKSLPQQLKMENAVHQAELDETSARIENYRRIQAMNAAVMGRIGKGASANPNDDGMRDLRFYDPKTGMMDYKGMQQTQVQFPRFSTDPKTGELLPTAFDPKTGSPVPTWEGRETRDVNGREARDKIAALTQAHKSLSFLEHFWKENPNGGLGLQPKTNVDYDNAINSLAMVWPKAVEGVNRYSSAEGSNVVGASGGGGDLLEELASEGHLSKAATGGGPGIWNALTSKGPEGVKLMRAQLQQAINSTEENYLYPKRGQ